MVTQSNINLCAMPNAKKQTNSIAQGTRVLKHKSKSYRERFLDLRSIRRADKHTVK